MTMPPSTRPLVSIVTPVHNGAAYLAETIQSVLEQTYRHWEHVIVDNHSTDETGEIARQFAARDERIRIVETPEFFPVLKNFNFSLRQTSPAAAYCKLVPADDLLFPRSLEQKVDLAERHPSVGVVGSYWLCGTRVEPQGVPYPTEVLPGHDVCRTYLLGGPRLFGWPAGHLFRADLVRARPEFFDESELHSDHAACFDVLQESDFGFVHQVLTYARLHDESITVSFSNRMKTMRIADISFLKAYGPVYLTPEEQKERLRDRRRLYYGNLISLLLHGDRREVWTYHARRMREIGEPLRITAVARTLLGRAIDRALNPKRTVEGKLARRNPSYAHRNRPRRGIQGSRGTERA
jgi:glycosyltransferase involved in cell wall biosynthesis